MSAACIIGDLMSCVLPGFPEGGLRCPCKRRTCGRNQCHQRGPACCHCLPGPRDAKSTAQHRLVFARSPPGTCHRVVKLPACLNLGRLRFTSVMCSPSTRSPPCIIRCRCFTVHTYQHMPLEYLCADSPARAKSLALVCCVLCAVYIVHSNISRPRPLPGRPCTPPLPSSSPRSSLVVAGRPHLFALPGSRSQRSAVGLGCAAARAVHGPATAPATAATDASRNLQGAKFDRQFPRIILDRPRFGLRPKP